MATRFDNPPLIFGEVMVDVFPDGSEYLGGCAMNVAWHLKGLGLEPLFVSRVGQDAYGEKIKSWLSQWGLSLEGIQEDPEHPTGVVNVHFKENGDVHYTTQPDQAVDYVELPKAEALANEAGLIYFGTWQLRKPVTRETQWQLRRKGKPVFIDVNIRPPFSDNDRVRPFITGADYLKANDHEMVTILEDENSSSLAKKASQFVSQFQVKELLLTLEEEGAELHTSQQRWQSQSTLPAPLANPVGAGDAFCAAYIQGLYEGGTPEENLKRACAFAAKVCTIPGATTTDVGFYR